MEDCGIDLYGKSIEVTVVGQGGELVERAPMFGSRYRHLTIALSEYKVRQGCRLRGRVPGSAI